MDSSPAVTSTVKLPSGYELFDSSDNLVTVLAYHTHYTVGTVTALTVTTGNTTLTAGTDYEVTYSGDTTNVGTVTVTVTFKNHYSGTAQCTYQIEKATNSWTTAPSIGGWVHGKTSSDPQGTAKFGEVTVTYAGTTNAGASYAASTERPTAAGSYTATFKVDGTNNYTALEKKISFTIERADNNQVPTVTATDETISGKGDGGIGGLTTGMEISTDGNNYSKITDSHIFKNYAVGTYYVRYSETANSKASEVATVTVAAGEKLTVSVPSTQSGYELTASAAQLNWQDNVTLTYNLLDSAYADKDNLVVKVTFNGDIIDISNELKADGSYTINNAKTNVTVVVTDNAAADVTLSVKGVGWKKFLNTVTFGLFFKDNVRLTVNASDLGNGIVKAEYLITDDAFTTETAVKNDEGNWKALTLANGTAGIDINEASKKYVYVRVTDNAGNITVVSSNGGIVVYTDSAADTTAINYTKTTTADVTAKVALKGNTVKEIYNGIERIAGENYAVADDGTITFKATYLDTLAAGQYTLHIVYNPQGEAYSEYVDENNQNINDTPATTSITLTVKKQTATLTAIEDLSKTYDGAAVTDPSYTSNSDGTVTIEWYKDSVAEENKLTEAPKNVGSYVVRVAIVGSDNYDDIGDSKSFTISKKEVTIVGVTVESEKDYDGNVAAVITNNGTLSANYDGENVASKQVQLPTATRTWEQE